MQYLKRNQKGMLIMKKILSVVVSVVAMVTVSHAQVTSVENSVYEFANSPYNFANSPYNYANSPYNFDNSAYNPYAKNAVYDAQGNRVGYATTTDQNVTNYYNNQGVRKGYQVK
jgi:uncharacterized protein YxeA